MWADAGGGRGRIISSSRFGVMVPVGVVAGACAPADALGPHHAQPGEVRIARPREEGELASVRPDRTWTPAANREIEGARTWYSDVRDLGTVAL